MREIIRLTGIDPDNEEIWKEISNQIRNEPLVLDVHELRTTTIFTLCEEFCDRFEDGAILDHCRETIAKLHDHPATPLVRGDAALWGGDDRIRGLPECKSDPAGKGRISHCKGDQFFLRLRAVIDPEQAATLKALLPG